METYCSRCGEKRRESTDWKLSEISGEVISEITDLEHSKLWRTLRLLLSKPGQLTAEYWHGRRKPSLGPVKLYLICFALSLVLYSIHQASAVYDVRTLAKSQPGGNFVRLLETRAAQRGLSAEQFATELNSRWQSYISMSQLAYPFFVALALKLLFVRRPFYLTQHIVFALHVLAFAFLSQAIVWPLYVALGLKPTMTRIDPAYLLLTAGTFLWTSAYFFLALRRTYGERALSAATKTVIVFITYIVTASALLLGTFAVALAVTSRSG